MIDASPSTLTIGKLEKGTSLWWDAWYRLLRNKMAVVSGIFVTLLIILVLATPWITPYPFDEISYEEVGISPSSLHLFGTDILGRDLFTRCLYGLRISLAIGLVGTVVTLVIGVIWGAISGYLGGKADALMMRFVDFLYSFPDTYFLIILMSIFGRSILLIFIGIGSIEWPTLARIVRGQVLSLKNKEFIEAAHAIGVYKLDVIFKHLVPNALGPVIIYTTLMVPRVILLEAFLSFLGLGVQAPMASLGSLCADGATGMELYPWLIIFPGVILALVLFAMNYLGDGLRDALDPRMKTA